MPLSKRPRTCCKTTRCSALVPSPCGIDSQGQRLQLVAAETAPHDAAGAPPGQLATNRTSAASLRDPTTPGFVSYPGSPLAALSMGIGYLGPDSCVLSL